MEFKVVLICIPVLLVKLSIFSCVYWYFKCLFYCIGLFLFLVNCSSLYILLTALNTNSFVSYVKGRDFFPRLGHYF